MNLCQCISCDNPSGDVHANIPKASVDDCFYGMWLIANVDVTDRVN